MALTYSIIRGCREECELLIGRIDDINAHDKVCQIYLITGMNLYLYSILAVVLCVMGILILHPI